MLSAGCLPVASEPIRSLADLEARGAQERRPKGRNAGKHRQENRHDPALAVVFGQWREKPGDLAMRECVWQRLRTESRGRAVMSSLLENGVVCCALRLRASARTRAPSGRLAGGW